MGTGSRGDVNNAERISKRGRDSPISGLFQLRQFR
jgi:hypothetical protein